MNFHDSDRPDTRGGEVMEPTQDDSREGCDDNNAHGVNDRREMLAPNIAIERLQRNPTTADAEWVPTWGPGWPTTFNTLRDAISAALRQVDETLLIHRVLHDGDVVWASDGVQ